MVGRSDRARAGSSWQCPRSGQVVPAKDDRGLGLTFSAPASSSSSHRERVALHNARDSASRPPDSEPIPTHPVVRADDLVLAGPDDRGAVLDQLPGGAALFLGARGRSALAAIEAVSPMSLRLMISCTSTRTSSLGTRQYSPSVPLPPAQPASRSVMRVIAPKATSKRGSPPSCHHVSTGRIS